MKSKHPIFLKSISGLLFAMALGFLLFTRADKSKSSFQNVSGIITSFSNSIESFPDKDSSKFRYLQLDNFPKTFELFIGKDFSDFSPAYERLDKLKVGDTITIYFDETKSSNPYFNRSVQFINKGQTPYFIRGRTDLYVGCSAILVCAGLVAYLLFLKKEGKII